MGNETRICPLPPPFVLLKLLRLMSILIIIKFSPLLIKGRGQLEARLFTPERDRSSISLSEDAKSHRSFHREPCRAGRLDSSLNLTT
ncbi:hypothetical protein GJAV_G00073940 [Gymnothorax javanicus]|nr:hypothetical protein GJAV_G00073940 [Gymnothorax javanicus]